MAALVALSCVFGLGVCFSLLGSIGVKLMPRLAIDRGRFGTLISAFMFTCLVVSLIAGVVTDKLGYGPVAVFGFAATALAMLLLGRAASFASAVLCCVGLGFGAMALNTAGNTLIPVVLFGGTNPAAASNLGNVFFGLGLFLTPLLVSVLFRKVSYPAAVSLLGLLILVPVAPAVLAAYPKAAAGLMLAPCFPTTVGLVSARHPVNFGGAFGVIFAGAMLGGVLVPKAIGNLARGATLQKSLRLLVPICLLVALSVLALGTLAE